MTGEKGLDPNIADRIKLKGTFILQFFLWSWNLCVNFFVFFLDNKELLDKLFLDQSLNSNNNAKAATAAGSLFGITP